MGHGAPPQKSYESEEESQMHWEIWDPIVDGERNVRAQVAHFICPSAKGEAFLTKCTTLHPKTTPTA